MCVCTIIQFYRLEFETTISHQCDRDWPGGEARRRIVLSCLVLVLSFGYYETKRNGNTHDSRAQDPDCGMYIATQSISFRSLYRPGWS